MADLVASSNVPRVETPEAEAELAPRSAIAPRRILVCVNESTSSSACLGYAIAVARSLGQTVTLLHVMDPRKQRPTTQTPEPIEWEIARQEAKARLEKLESLGVRTLGRSVEVRLEQGPAAERITTIARELDVDITVLGGQSESGVAAGTFGPTMLQVLAVARGSLLIARSNAPIVGEVVVKRILVPLDGSLRAESVLPVAVRIARRHGSELLLAFVVREPVATEVLSAPEDVAVARDLANRVEVSSQRYVERLREQLTREGTAVRALVLRDADEGHALLELCRREQTDLIVLSAHGVTCNRGLPFGSVTAHLLNHSSASMLVLQDVRQRRGQEDDRRAPPRSSNAVPPLPPVDDKSS